MFSIPNYPIIIAFTRTYNYLVFNSTDLWVNISPTQIKNDTIVSIANIPDTTQFYILTTNEISLFDYNPFNNTYNISTIYKGE